MNFDKKFQSFKNHVNNEILRGQELPNNTLNAYNRALKNSCKSYYNLKNHVNNDILRGQELPNSTSNAYNRALKNSYKSYYNLQEPLNQNPLNMEKSAKIKNKKNSPRLEICCTLSFLGFFGLQHPPPSPT